MDVLLAVLVVVACLHGTIALRRGIRRIVHAGASGASGASGAAVARRRRQRAR